MKNKKKVFFGIAGLGLLAVGLSSCTNTFCSNTDKARMMYAFDVYTIKDYVVSQDADPLSGQFSYGISTYYDRADTNKPAEAQDLPGYANVAVKYNVESNLSLAAINRLAVANGVRVDNYTEFWSRLDDRFLALAIEKSGMSTSEVGNLTLTELSHILVGDPTTKTAGFGYVKYIGNENDTYWENWNRVFTETKIALGPDKCPDSDFVNQYQTSMKGYVAGFNSCLATTDGFYGYYGYDNGDKTPVYVGAKDWNYAWSRGFLEGLIIYPIGWFIDNIAINFLGNGVPGGWAQALSILLVTILIRAIMLLLTINQTLSNAKMSEVQPEVAKIQAKYPNANTNRNEQQALAQETQALYKKNKIHPFLSILVLLVQFPVFICVWGAMTGSAVLSSDTLLGLRLSDSVSTVIFSGANGWITAVVMFAIMALLQVISMLLPQWINKHKAKGIAKTGKNPNVKSQNDKMKWFTLIMLVFVIFMGFSLASGMVIYWIAGSIWAIAQTLIIELITLLRKNHKKNKGKKVPVTVDGKTIEAEIIPEHIAAPTGKKKFKDKKDGK